jgi:diadenosine tetraphosphate (Ap4A) HIT family hydrolase
VPALHIHVIARYKTDGVWPAPVWGLGEALPYSSEKKEQVIKTIREALDENGLLGIIV